MKKIISVLFCIFSLCYAFSAKKRIPQWITVPSAVYPSETYMNGIGSGETREVAEVEAVKNLAQVFGQTVRAESTASKKMEQAVSDGKVVYSTSGNLHQNITTIIDSENLIGIEIAEYFYNSSEKKWYAIAILHREKTSLIYLDMIQKNDEAVRNALRESEKHPGSFYGYSEICFALEIAEENDRLLKNMQVIDFDRAESVRHTIISLQNIQALQKKFAETITIFVNILGDSDNKIKSSFQNAFSKYGFKTSSSKKEKYCLEGSYSSEISQKQKIFYCTYILNLEFFDSSTRESLFAINLKGREGSFSETDARNRTFRVLEKNIETEFSRNFDSYINKQTFD